MVEVVEVVVVFDFPALDFPAQDAQHNSFKLTFVPTRPTRLSVHLKPYFRTVARAFLQVGTRPVNNLNALPMFAGTV